MVGAFIIQRTRTGTRKGDFRIGREGKGTGERMHRILFRVTRRIESGERGGDAKKNHLGLLEI